LTYRLSSVTARMKSSLVLRVIRISFFVTHGKAK
jgi:hypothetical protein